MFRSNWFVLIQITLLLLTVGCEQLRPNGGATQPTATVEQITPQRGSSAEPIIVMPVTPPPTDVILNLPTAENDFQLDIAPKDWTQLPEWLAVVWQADMSRETVAQALQAAGWLIPDQPLPAAGAVGSFAQADLDGDGLDEWLISVRQPFADSHAPIIPFQRAYPGNFYIIGRSGTLYQHYPNGAISAEFAAAPFLLSLQDFNADGNPDVLIDELNHNGQQYFGRFYLLTLKAGVMRDLSSTALKQVRPQPQLTIDNGQVAIRSRFASNPSDPTGYWQNEQYQWDGQTLALSVISIESPQDFASLATYLNTQWQAQTDSAKVRADLLNWGWLREDKNWVTEDFDGDLRSDWAVVVSAPTAEASNGYQADLWIVSAAGVYQLSADSAEYSREPTQHSISRLQDVTQDGLPELLSEQIICGASTCYNTFRIISDAKGTLASIVANNTQPINGDAAVSTVHDGITQPFADLSIVQADPAQPVQLRVHGGVFGSIGAGVMRSYATLWAWSAPANAIVQTGIELDATNYRHLLLYEANGLAQNAVSNGLVDDPVQRATAIQLYQRVITDTLLLDPDPLDATISPAPQAAVQQFAAFRLIYIALNENNLAEANTWISYLENNHTNAALTLAARAMLDAADVGATPTAGCAAALSILAGYENPLGALHNLGYGNPSLTVADLCTTEQ